MKALFLLGNECISELDFVLWKYCVRVIKQMQQADLQKVVYPAYGIFEGA
jgi:hypothetical protein